VYKRWYEYDRDYSFVPEYLKKYGRSDYIFKKAKKALRTYAKGRKLLKYYVNIEGVYEVKDKLRKIRKAVDRLLGVEGLSLKELRMLYVTDNLGKELGDKHIYSCRWGKQG